MEEYLELVNPLEELAIWENPKPRRKPKASFAPSLLSLALIGGAIFTLMWKHQKGSWPWEGLGRRRLQTKVIASRNNPGIKYPLDPGPYGNPYYGANCDDIVTVDTSHITKPVVIKTPLSMENPTIFETWK
jgi:hypothetical protein